MDDVAQANSEASTIRVSQAVITALTGGFPVSGGFDAVGNSGGTWYYATWNYNTETSRLYMSNAPDQPGRVIYSAGWPIMALAFGTFEYLPATGSSGEATLRPALALALNRVVQGGGARAFTVIGLLLDAAGNPDPVTQTIDIANSDRASRIYYECDGLHFDDSCPANAWVTGLAAANFYGQSFRTNDRQSPLHALAVAINLGTPSGTFTGATGLGGKLFVNRYADTVPRLVLPLERPLDQSHFRGPFSPTTWLATQEIAPFSLGGLAAGDYRGFGTDQIAFVRELQAAQGSGQPPSRNSVWQITFGTPAAPIGSRDQIGPWLDEISIDSLATIHLVAQTSPGLLIGLTRAGSQTVHFSRTANFLRTDATIVNNLAEGAPHGGGRTYVAGFRHWPPAPPPPTVINVETFPCNSEVLVTSDIPAPITYPALAESHIPTRTVYSTYGGSPSWALRATIAPPDPTIFYDITAPGATTASYRVCNTDLTGLESCGATMTVDTTGTGNLNCPGRVAPPFDPRTSCTCRGPRHGRPTACACPTASLPARPVSITNRAVSIVSASNAHYALRAQPGGRRPVHSYEYGGLYCWEASSLLSGAQIELTRCAPGVLTQRFVLTQPGAFAWPGGADYYTIRPVLDPTLCANVRGGTEFGGEIVQLYACGSPELSSNEQFRLPGAFAFDSGKGPGGWSGSTMGILGYRQIVTNGGESRRGTSCVDALDQYSNGSFFNSVSPNRPALQQVACFCDGTNANGCPGTSSMQFLIFDWGQQTLY
jgi:hypothetical protein